MLNASYQQANDQASYAGGGHLSNFYTANLAHSFVIALIHTTLATAINYYLNESPGVKSVFCRPTFNLSKSFLEKTLKGSLASSYNKSSTNGQASSDIWNTRLSFHYTPATGKNKGAGKHNFSLGINALRKIKGTAQQPAFTEFTNTFGYTYSF